MPRPKKCRKVCAMPESCAFGPTDGACTGGKCAPARAEEIAMTIDEYETIRLIDGLDYTQEMCAQQMGVARTTVQAVYNEARKKLAQMLTEGRPLTITGGHYAVCPNAEGCHNKKGCGYEGCCHMK